MNEFLFSMLLVIPTLITLGFTIFLGTKLIVYVANKWSHVNLINAKLTILVNTILIFILALIFPYIVSLCAKIPLASVMSFILIAIIGIVFISIQLILIIAIIGKLLKS